MDIKVTGGGSPGSKTHGTPEHSSCVCALPRPHTRIYAVCYPRLLIPVGIRRGDVLGYAPYLCDGMDVMELHCRQLWEPERLRSPPVGISHHADLHCTSDLNNPFLNPILTAPRLFRLGFVSLPLNVPAGLDPV